MAAASHPDRVPVGVDPTKASIARVYDAFLGGKDNYAIDREVYAAVADILPEADGAARDNRAFLVRACRFLATECGIKQFLDCGSGLPTVENVHEVVQRVDPDINVVYVDNDPVVLAHGLAILEENERSHFVSADIFTPSEVLDNPTVRRYIDFTEPVALLHFATMHHYDGVRPPADILGEYIDALPSGSYVAISHFLDPENEHTPLARKVESVFRDGPLGSGVFRTMAEITEMFSGLELVEPGLTRTVDWWPDGPRLNELTPLQHCLAGGIGRKP